MLVDEDKVEEEANDTCAKQHSSIRLSIVNEVDNNSTEGDNNNKRNKTDNETTKSNEEASIRGSGFSVLSLDDNCRGSIDSAIGGGLLVNPQSSSDPVDEDSNNNDSTFGIRGLKNDDKILVEEESEDTCIGSPRENRCTIIGNNKYDKENGNEIFLHIQGTDLRRFDKYKNRLHLITAPQWYKKLMLKQECIEVGWVSIPYYLLLSTMHLLSCKIDNGSSLI